MILVKYIFLGIIQGFTEPLPISSSGHLKILRHLLNDNFVNDMNFEIIVNLGSLLAILYLYKSEIIRLIKEYFLFIKSKNSEYKTNFNYGNYVIIGTIPAAIFGMLMKDTIEKYFSTKLVGISFIITALMLFIIKDKNGIKNKKTMSKKDAIKIGFFQLFALFPGISRSGSTITGARLCGIDKDTSINYSFMLYIPISIASFLLGIMDLKIKKYLLIPYIVSMLCSFITTLFSAKLFINIFKKGKLIYFSIYCILLGLLTIFII